MQRLSETSLWMSVKLCSETKYAHLPQNTITLPFYQLSMFSWKWPHIFSYLLNKGSTIYSIKIIIFLLLTIIFLPINSYGTDSILESQMETLNISSFIKEGEKYTKESFPDLSGNNLLKSAIAGKVDNSSIFKNILSLLGKEIITAITLLRKLISNYCCT